MQYMDMHKYRDVRGNQNMERGEREKPKSKIPYLIAVFVLTFGALIIGILALKLFAHWLYGFQLLNQSGWDGIVTSGYSILGLSTFPKSWWIWLLISDALLGLILYDHLFHYSISK